MGGLAAFRVECTSDEGFAVAGWQGARRGTSHGWCARQATSPGSCTGPRVRPVHRHRLPPARERQLLGARNPWTLVEKCSEGQTLKGPTFACRKTGTAPTENRELPADVTHVTDIGQAHPWIAERRERRETGEGHSLHCLHLHAWRRPPMYGFGRGSTRAGHGLKHANGGSPAEEPHWRQFDTRRTAIERVLPRNPALAALFGV